MKKWKIMSALRSSALLARKYKHVFKAAWARRADLAPKVLLPHEAEFRPAALSLASTPPSPVARSSIWLILSFASCAIAWSVIGTLDVTAVAQGKVIPDGKSKTIQPTETVSVRSLLVKEGQSVHQGQVLVELDASATRADAEKAEAETVSAALEAARQKAMSDAIETGRTPVPAWPAGVGKERVERELSVLRGEWSDYSAKKARLEAALAARSAELRTVSESIGKLSGTAPLAIRRAEDYKVLADRGFISKHGLMEKEQARIETLGDLSVQRARSGELHAAMAQASADITALKAETLRASTSAYAEASKKAAAAGFDLAKATARDGLMTLRSPVEGTVQQLAIHTVGGVVTPAQPLMVIVPKDSKVEIEAVLENRDVGFVEPGQEVAVKMETFLYTRYGTVPARVVSVSRDAMTDEKKGLVFTVRVVLDRAWMDIEGKRVQLTPGMAASVEIKTGTRRVYEYFMSPLVQSVTESARER